MPLGSTHWVLEVRCHCSRQSTRPARACGSSYFRVHEHSSWSSQVIGSLPCSVKCNVFPTAARMAKAVDNTRTQLVLPIPARRSAIRWQQSARCSSIGCSLRLARRRMKIASHFCGECGVFIFASAVAHAIHGTAAQGARSRRVTSDGCGRQQGRGLFGGAPLGCVMKTMCVERRWIRRS